MNDKQPEALRLAKIIDEGSRNAYGRQAAAELRRLYKENEALRAELALLKKISIKDQRDAAWTKRDLTKCICDHIEYCVHCYPIEFRQGGYWDQQEAQGDKND